MKSKLTKIITIISLVIVIIIIGIKSLGIEFAGSDTKAEYLIKIKD